jgi:ribosomal protein L7/L12
MQETLDLMMAAINLMSLAKASSKDPRRFKEDVANLCRMVEDGIWEIRRLTQLINRHDLSEKEMELAMDIKNKIPAIKELRARTGKDLNQAKDIIEDFMEDNNVPGFKRFTY